MKVHFYEEPDSTDYQSEFKFLYKEKFGNSVMKSSQPCRAKDDYDSRFKNLSTLSISMEIILDQT